MFERVWEAALAACVLISCVVLIGCGSSGQTIAVVRPGDFTLEIDGVRQVVQALPFTVERPPFVPYLTVVGTGDAAVSVLGFGQDWSTPADVARAWTQLLNEGEFDIDDAEASGELTLIRGAGSALDLAAGRRVHSDFVVVAQSEPHRAWILMCYSNDSDHDRPTATAALCEKAANGFKPEPPFGSN